MNVSKMLFAVSLLALTACTTKVVKQDELSRVKRVAIIGLDVQQQQSVSGGDLAAIAFKTADKPTAKPTLRTDSSHIHNVYKNLSDKIEVQTGWQVLNEDSVKKNPAYAQLFKDKTEGFQNRPMINERFTLYTVPGILDSFAVLTSKPEKLIALAKALKVDALIYSTSTVNLNNNSVFASMVGAGEFKPSATGSVFVLDGRTGEKIFMNSGEGPKVDQGERNTLGMANVEKLNTLAQMATASSMDVILKELSLKR